MVGRSFIIALTLLATPASADPPDWTQAGGSLFIEPGLKLERKLAEGPKPSSTLDEVRADPMPNFGEVRLLPAKQPFDALIRQIATETGLDPKLLHALVIVESAYDSQAISPVGARGLTQLMPATARELGVADAFDREENLRGGARYLAAQIGRFGDLRLALAAYNAGPNRVARLGRVPDISETQNYVRDAVDCYLALTAGRGIRHRNQCRATGRR
jgi:soluble lytic murein transglycosylase-like protein